MTLRFGTDGVRGVANEELTPELVLALGRASAQVLGSGPWIVGRDPRRSGPLIEACLSAGLAAEGASVRREGVLPTPAVAWLAAADELPAAVISASHNPYADNGIKLFAPGGRKLGDAQQAELEAALDAVVRQHRTTPGVVGTGVGVLDDDHRGAERYVEATLATVGGRDLAGMRVVLDTANGAASAVAPEVFRRAGADVIVLHDQPDGVNINQRCGSTDPATLQHAVVATGAVAGLAFDGDADRVVAVDHRGRLVDGDHVIALCALDLRERGLLAGDTVVVTVMTNLGFHLAMADHGVKVVETPVGDRAVLEALEEGGWSLGGEQSGHIIFRDLATTGDGVLTGLQLLDVLARRGASLAELADGAMTRLPQVLRNVAVAERRADVADALAAEIAAARRALGEQGRVLVRPSGTEPLVRVMVEAASETLASDIADELARAVTGVCGPA